MTVALNWRFTISFNVNAMAKFGKVVSAIQELIDTITANRTTAKFIIARGIQLLTVFVMLSRAMIST